MNSFDTIKLKHIHIHDIEPTDILLEYEYKPTYKADGTLDYWHYKYKVDDIFGISSLYLKQLSIEVTISSKILEGEHLKLINISTFDIVYRELSRYIPKLKPLDLENATVTEIHVTQDIELTERQLFKLHLLELRDHYVDTPKTGIIIQNRDKDNKRYFTVYNKLKELDRKEHKDFNEIALLPPPNVYRVETKLQNFNSIRERLTGSIYFYFGNKRTLSPPTLAQCLNAGRNCLSSEIEELMKHEIHEMTPIPANEYKAIIDKLNYKYNPSNLLTAYALLQYFKGDKNKMLKFLTMQYSVDIWKKHYSPFVKYLRPYLRKDGEGILKELNEKLQFENENTQFENG